MTLLTPFSHTVCMMQAIGGYFSNNVRITCNFFFVIGGSGFLGRHVIEALVTHGDPVVVFDITQPYHFTSFYSGDISDQAQVSEALRKVP
jgi:hypothetical protein